MKIGLTCDQRAVITCKATAEVPDDVAAEGTKAVADWLEDNQEEWSDDQPTIETDYGEMQARSNPARSMSCWTTKPKDSGPEPFQEGL